MELYPVNCQLCGGDQSEEVISFKGSRYVRCCNCGLVYLNPRPPPDYLDKFYKGSESFTIDIHKDPYPETAAYQFRFSINIKTINKFQQNKGRLLDIGCAWGYFLNSAEEEGWDAYGVELSRSESEYAKARFGLKVFNGNVVEAGFPSQYFDVVTLWHTLEHFSNPVLELSEIKRILKKDGLLVVEVPSSKMVKEDLLNGKIIPGRPPMHLLYYSADTLRLLFQKTGFKVIKLKGCGSTRIVSRAVSLGYGSVKTVYIKYFRYLKYIKLVLQKLMVFFKMNENIIVFARPIPGTQYLFTRKENIK